MKIHPKKYATLLLFLLPLQAFAETALIAVATNFTPTMKAIVTAFEEDTPHRLQVSFASSGKLYAQIKNGAPFDLLLSADQAIPQRLIKEGNAMLNSQSTYAEGKLALWSNDNTLIDNQGAVLYSRHFHRIALANPKLAPYGLAATQVLAKLKLTKSTNPLWVQGENIGQTYQFVRSGNAEIGFVALSQIQIDHEIKEGSFWIVPHHLYDPIKQDLVVLKKGEGNPAISDFLDFLSSPKIQKLIESYGYTASLHSSS